MNNNFENLKSEDVVSVYARQIFISSRTFTVVEFIAAMMQATKKQLGDLTEGKETWFGEGLECKILKPGAKSWERGKVRISLEFEPEELEITQTVESSELENNKSESPLDDIRQRMSKDTQQNNS